MKNFALKLFSVLCAVGLSYYVQNPAQSSVIGFVAPIEFKNIPEGKFLISPLSPQARVTIRGPSRFVQRVSAGKHNFQVVAQEASGNKFSATLNERDLDIPGPVEVISIDPPEIEVILDDRVSREVSVLVPRLGAISEEYKLMEFTVTPSKLKLSGPKGELDKIQSIESEPIDLTAVKGSVEEQASIRVPSSFISANAQHVNVKIEVVSVQKEKRYKALPIEVRDVTGSDLSVAPSQATVEISAGIKMIESLKAEEIVPYVKLMPESKVGDRVKIQVDLPKGASLVAVDPEEVLLGKIDSRVSSTAIPKAK